MACTICKCAEPFHGSQLPHARPGTHLNESGCHDGVWMDDDEHAEGWEPDVIYPPCPNNPARCMRCNGTGNAPDDVTDRDDCQDCHGTGWANGKAQWPTIYRRKRASRGFRRHVRRLKALAA